MKVPYICTKIINYDTGYLSEKKQHIIPLLQKGKTNSYRPEDIKYWGVDYFMDTVCAKEDIVIPSLGFTVEENERMEEILKEEELNNDI